MANANPAEIIDALCVHVGQLVTGTPTLPVAYPEMPGGFTPPADGKFLEVQVDLNAPAWISLAGAKLGQGLFTVTVVWPKNGGVVRPAEIAKLIEDHFPPGLILASGQTRVKISAGAWTATPLTEPDRVSTPVTIPWTA